MAGTGSSSGGWLLGIARFVLMLVLAVGTGNALWQTFLVNLSSRTVATALITEVGAAFVTPAIASRSDGLNEAGWSALQDSAKLHPNDPLPVPGLKVAILGKEIAGKSYTDGMRAIYAKLAGTYYDGGPSAVFDPDSVWAQTFSSLDQLAQSGLAGQGGAVVQVPSIAAGLLTSALQVLTAQGHAAAVTRDNWSIGIASALALLLVLVSRRWGRLFNVAFGALLGVLPGAAVLAGFAYQWSRSPQLFQPDATLLHLVGNQLAPLYLAAIGATLTGIAVAIAGAIAAKVIAARAGAGAPAPARARADRERERKPDREPGRGAPEPFAPPPPAGVRLALPPEETSAAKAHDAKSDAQGSEAADPFAATDPELSASDPPPA